MTDSSLGYQIFCWVKYLIYALLSLNIWLFLAEENDSARFAIASGEDVVMGVQLFSATLDTLAWVILLLLFELETAVIPDDRLKGPLRFGIYGVRMMCAAVANVIVLILATRMHCCTRPLANFASSVWAPCKASLDFKRYAAF